MKTERIIITIAFVLIGLIMVGIFCFMYRPIFSGPLSVKHADWEAFGDFFWGLGTMLLTGLNVIVLLLVNRQLREYNDKQQSHQDTFELKLEEDRKAFQIKSQREEEFARYINNFQCIIIDSINKENPSENEMMFYSNKLLLLLWSLQTLEWLPDNVKQEVEDLRTAVNGFLIAEAANPSKTKLVKPTFSAKIVLPSIELYKSLISIKGINLQ